jgi:hypothetical protein
VVSIITILSKAVPGIENAWNNAHMSRAFVNEDAGGWGNPARKFDLPGRDDPGFDKAAAEAMLEAAREGDTGSAEMATGYYWGEEKLKPYVREILARVEKENDERMIQLAERFLR